MKQRLQGCGAVTLQLEPGKQVWAQVKHVAIID